MPKSGPELVRVLNFSSTLALVINSIVGTGVFFKAAVMTQWLQSPVLVLLAWLVAGAFSLAGALTYAELACLFPRAGGEYVYLKEGYGSAVAFLCGWMRLIISSAGVSALAVGFTTFLAVLVPFPSSWMSHHFVVSGHAVHWEFGTKQVVAVAVILSCGALNCFGVVFGGHLQRIVGAVKILGIVLLAAGALLFGRIGHPFTATSVPPGVHLQAFGAAIIAALWACDGWAYMPMMASEVQKPERTIPRALFAGMAIVLLVYLLVNASYFVALSPGQVAASSSTRYPNALPVAAKAAEAFLGSHGTALVSVLVMLSAVGALNAVILTTARIPYAMARDRLFFATFGVVSPGAHVPVFSVVIISLWSAILAISGTFDQLTNMYVFGLWLFYALGGGAVLVLRWRRPSALRPYRTIGYPFVPLVFIGAALWLVLDAMETSPIESIAGFVLILIGLPLYVFWRSRSVDTPL